MSKLQSQSSPLFFLAWTSLVAGIVLLSVVQSSSAFVIPPSARRGISQTDLQGIDVPRFLFTRNTRARVQRSRDPPLRYRLNVAITGPKSPVLQDEQVVLECTATGPKPSVVYWLKNGENVSQNKNFATNAINEDDVVKGGFTFTEVKSKYFIDCASPADEAEYTCVAVYADGKESITYKLEVSTAPSIVPSPQCHVPAKKSMHFNQGTPARITMWTYNKMAPSGANVVLVCRAQGTNVATNWYNEETKQLITEQDHGRIRVLDNGDLEIKDIQWKDMGGYSCAAENDLGSDRQTAFLYPFAPSSSESSW